MINIWKICKQLSHFNFMSYSNNSQDKDVDIITSFSEWVLSWNWLSKSIFIEPKYSYYLKAYRNCVLTMPATFSLAAGVLLDRNNVLCLFSHLQPMENFLRWLPQAPRKCCSHQAMRTSRPLQHSMEGLERLQNVSFTHFHVLELFVFFELLLIFVWLVRNEICPNVITSLKFGADHSSLCYCIGTVVYMSNKPNTVSVIVQWFVLN